MNTGEGDNLVERPAEEQLRQKQQLIGKVCFLKEKDIEKNWFEREVSKWVPMFYYKMTTLCTKKPRFSEMRPIRYNI